MRGEGAVIEGDFARDGCVCVRGAVGPAELTRAEAAIAATLERPSPLAIRASPPDDGAFVEDFCNWERLDAVKDFALASAGAEVAAQLMGSSAVRLFHDHVLVKEPATAQPTPWHQDQPYYNVAGRQNVSMWLPVDPVPRSSTLELVAGGHRGPWYLPRTFLDGEARWFPEGSLAEMPDFEADPERFPIRGWALEPGDAVFFHMLTPHRAAGSETRRRVITLRYLGDDIVHAPRDWITSPPFPGLDAELPAGAPMDHSRFPVVWPRWERASSEQ